MRAQGGSRKKKCQGDGKNQVGKMGEGPSNILNSFFLSATAWLLRLRPSEERQKN
jgi:hypothetical protein